MMIVKVVVILDVVKNIKSYVFELIENEVFFFFILGVYIYIYLLSGKVCFYFLVNFFYEKNRYQIVVKLEING